MQKKIIRIIKKPFDYSTSELFQKSKILTISKIYKLRVLIHAHNTYHNVTNTHNSMYNTRNSFCCNIPILLFKTSSGQKTIEYQESALWNRLPLCLKQIENPIAFKRELKRHLLGQIFVLRFWLIANSGLRQYQPRYCAQSPVITTPEW